MENPHVISHGVVWRNAHSFFRYCGWPSVCRDEDGVLYAAASGFRVSHICPFGKTALFLSHDGGATWSVPLVVNDTYLDDRDAGIVSLGGRSLLVSWFAHPTEVYQTTYRGSIERAWGGSAGVLGMYDSIPAEYGRGGSFVRVSHDGGLTWGATVQVPVSAPHGPIRLADGTLLYLGKEHYSRGAEAPGVIAAWVSTDGGATWVRRGGLTPPEGTAWANFHEPHAVELPGGRLLGVIRAQGPEVAFGFTMYQTVSDDGGLTWSPMRPLGIPGSPPHLLRHSSGALILAYGRRGQNAAEEPSGAWGEHARISRDGGETWEEDVLLHEAAPSDLGYPATVELPDATLLTVYYQPFGPDGFPSVLCTRWRL